MKRLLMSLLLIASAVSANTKVWTPELKEIPAAQSTKVVPAAVNVKLYSDAGTSFGVPWPWIQENCNRRASAVNYALAAMTSSSSVSPIQPALTSAQVKKLLSAPTFTSAQIKLTGPLFGKQVISSKSGKTEETLYLWDHHVAALVKINGAYQVMDGSLGTKPIAIEKWIASYVSKGTKCELVNYDDYTETKMYYTTRQQFQGAPVPKKKCVYTFTQAFGAEPGKKFTDKDLVKELEETRTLLAGNAQNLQFMFGLDTLSSKVSPMGEKEFCQAMNHSILWCK